MASTLQFAGRSLFDLDDYSREEIMFILEAAKGMKEINLREYKKIPTLRGKTVCTLFVENSTRTRMSFELAANRLSADVVSFQSSISSLQKGESLQDTVYTLNAMGIDLYCIRHSSPGSPQLVNKYSGKPVINGGDGRHSHPTQALLDIFSIWEKLGDLKGLKITIVGDILNSRVVRSNLIGMGKLGAKVTVCGPKTLMPGNMESVYDKNAVGTDDGRAFPLSGRIQQTLCSLQRNLEICQEECFNYASRSYEQRSGNSTGNCR